jgi:hypothetical protein
MLGRLNQQSLIQGASAILIQRLGVSDLNREFEDWTWNILRELRIYIRPAASNAYALSVDYIFEHWDSVSLSTLKAYSASDPMSAYTILVISEIGHRFDLFDDKGWELLEVLIATGHFIPFLLASFDIFRTFVQVDPSPNILVSEGFRRVMNAFWKTGSLNSSWNLIQSFIEESMTTSFKSVKDGQFVIKFWCNVIFSSSDWISSRLPLEMLNKVCQVSAFSSFTDELLSQLSAQYRTLLFDFPNRATGGVSSINSIYQRASSGALFSKGSIRTFPTLIQDKTVYLTKNEMVGKGLLYFLLFAISVEIFAEKEIRNQIGSALSRNRPIAELASMTEKPISQFAIYRLVQLLQETPLNHPTSPILWQSFFSLYFERNREQDGYNNICFGHCFLSEQKSLLVQLEKKLSTFTSTDSTLVSWPNVVDAMSFWISEPRLILSVVNIDSFPSTYCPELLLGVVKGLLFDNGSRDWWKNFISEPMMPLLDNTPPLCFQKVMLSLEPSQPFPAISFKEPVLKSIQNLDFHDRLAILKSDISLLKQQGLHHSAFVQQHNDLDDAYLNLLGNLYSSSSTILNVTKRCSSSCPGVVFQFEQEKSIMNREISTSLSSNRNQAETLLGLDLVDSTTALSGLRITVILESISKLSEQDASVQKVAKDLFYGSLELQNMKLQAFPPADLIINTIIKMFGKFSSILLRQTFYCWQ